MKKLQKLDIGLIAVIFIIGISIVLTIKASELTPTKLQVGGNGFFAKDLHVNTEGADSDTAFTVENGMAVFNGEVSAAGGNFMVNSSGAINNVLNVGNDTSFCISGQCAYVKVVALPDVVIVGNDNCLYPGWGGCGGQSNGYYPLCVGDNWWEAQSCPSSFKGFCIDGDGYQGAARLLKCGYKQIQFINSPEF